MLSEIKAAQIYSETPEVPYYLFRELRYGTTIYSEADDIADFIVATGITYCEAVVTFASDESMMHPVGRSVLVPLRVLKLLSSLRPINIPVYASAFHFYHLYEINLFINACMKAQTLPRVLFLSDEPQPWEAMRIVCSELLKFIVPHFLEKPKSMAPPPPEEKPRLIPGEKPRPKQKAKKISPKPEAEKPSSEPKADKTSAKPKAEKTSPKQKSEETSPKLKAEKPFPKPTAEENTWKSNAEKAFPKTRKTKNAYVAPPEYYDTVRALQTRYLRGGELMCVYLQNSQVSWKAKPLENAVVKKLKKYSINLGPLKEFSVKKTENEGVGREDDGRIPGLNEVIHDANNGMTVPLKWLLSHVLCGRILGSNGDDSKTSWFPRRSSDGQHADEPLLLRRLTDIVGRRLLSDSEGNIVLPVRGLRMVGKLDMLQKKGGPSSTVRVQWREYDRGENFRKKVHKVWDNENLHLC